MRQRRPPAASSARTNERRRARDRDRPNPAQSGPAAACISTRMRSTNWRSRSPSAACSSRSWCGPTGRRLRDHRRRTPLARGAAGAACTRIPAIVRDDRRRCRRAELALIENIQREDLNAIEEAEGYRQLIERHGHSQDDVGQIVHKSRSHVANLLRLLDLPEFVRQSLLQGDISMGHARAVADGARPGGADPRNHRQGPVGAPGRSPRARARRKPPGRAGPEGAARSTPISPRSSGSSATARAQGRGRAQGQGRDGDAALFEPRPARHDLPAAVAASRSRRVWRSAVSAAARRAATASNSSPKRFAAPARSPNNKLPARRLPARSRQASPSPPRVHRRKHRVRTRFILPEQ